MPPPQLRSPDEERAPLLGNERWHGQDQGDGDGSEEDEQLITFEGDDDDEDPKQWPLKMKYVQVLQITMIGLLCPLASSLLTPANDNVAADFGVDKEAIIGAQSGFLHLLGVGPLFLAPLSETFGRRTIFLTNLTLFTIMQIPTALAPNLPALITLRTITGLFASVGIANGGGTISDMFAANERASVLGVYLLGPLLGPSLGPCLGGLINSRLNWRWVFWILFVVSTLLCISSYFFLHETYAPIVLDKRKKKLEKKHPDTKYRVEGASDQSVGKKVKANCSRAIRILVTQPIVLTMSIYQAVIFATMYTLYSTFTTIWTSPPYNFTKDQLGLTYLAPAFGFALAAIFVVPSIDKLYNKLAKERNDGEGLPEYRLPISFIGAVLLPISLFWFGWAVETSQHWAVALSSTLLFGASQVCIFNSTQNYYIDSFEKFAASALAAGAVLRSFMGAQVPLYVGGLFDKVGFGWGMSVFGFVAVALMPAPVVFWVYGGRLRERFAKDLS